MKTESEISFDRESIRRAAYSMIDNHGQSAARVAAQRANNLSCDVAGDARLMWQQIARTIEILQRPRRLAA
jgi:hypothetical protein